LEAKNKATTSASPLQEGKTPQAKYAKKLPLRTIVRPIHTHLKENWSGLKNGEIKEANGRRAKGRNPPPFSAFGPQKRGRQIGRYHVPKTSQDREIGKDPTLNNVFLGLANKDLFMGAKTDFGD